MKKSKLTLHRETLVRLDRARLARAAGGWSNYFLSCTCPASVEDCTNSCQTVCWGCDPPSGKPTECECP